MRTLLSSFSLLVLLFSSMACATSNAQSPTMTAEDPAFSTEILPLLQTKFVPLLAEESGADLSSWETIFEGSDHGEYIIPFNADNSLLIELATQLDPPHSAAAAITPAELARVRAWIDAGARNDAGDVPFEDATNLLYVANQGAAAIAIIDMDTQQVIRLVELTKLGLPANSNPHHTAVEPDGSHWYVSLIGASKVLKFNRDNELVGQADFETPGMLAIDPDSDQLFVGRSMMAVNPPQRIGLIQRSDMAIDEVDVFFARPHALTINPANDVVYTASLAEDRIAAVSTTDVEEVNLTQVPMPEDGGKEMDHGDMNHEEMDHGDMNQGGMNHEGMTHNMYVQFALSPNGEELVVGGEMSGKFHFFETTADPMSPRLLKTINVDAAPWHPVYSPDGRFVYFGNKNANAITVIDTEKREVAQVIRGNGIAEPHGAAVSPDGRYLFVSNRNLKGDYTPRYNLGDNAKVGTVVVIDTSTNEIVKILEVEPYPAGVGTRGM